MYSIDKFFNILNEYAPLSISYKMVEKGNYDNSGILIKTNKAIKKVLFSLDLSNLVVEKAIELGCDTIVTHHPAIYNPIKTIEIDGQTAPIAMSVMNNVNVISMHLNLDMAKEGIDFYLACALGGKNQKILDVIDESVGYGREFNCTTPLNELVNKIKTKLNTDKVLCYGENEVKKIATFCGGGASYALDVVLRENTEADTIVTSDMPHHVLKELVEKNKNVIIIPHYASEDYGFSKFYNIIKEQTNGKVETFYFEDRRFK